MKRFIGRLLLIATIVFIVDRVLGFALGYLYSDATTTDEYKINTVINTIEEPIIFMGSSRCHHHYIPSIIDDTLGIEVYNAGLWGMRNIYFQYGLLCNLLERYTPQTICLEVHPVDYLKTPFSDIERVGNLVPFVNKSPGCDEVLKKAGLYYKCLLSSSYRYNSLLPTIFLGNLLNRSFPKEKGFKELTAKLDTLNGPIQAEEFSLPTDLEKIHYLQKFVDKCHEKKIQLLFLYSPMYAVDRHTKLFNIPDSIAIINKIPFINHYDLNGITGHADCFSDYGHLNGNGARKYSSIIGTELKQYIK